MDKILFKPQQNYLKQFHTSSDSLITEMEEFAAAKRIPILDTNSAAFLEQIVMVKKPRRVLEIGTAIAYSTIRIARCLGKDCLIDTLEKSKDNIPLAQKFVKRSGMSKHINLIKGEAMELIPGLKSKYDLIFLDADKEDYLNLFEVSLRLLKKGGIYIVDNLLWHGFTAASRVPPKYKRSTKIIREFNKAFMNTDGLKTSIIPVGDGLGVGIKK